MTPSDFQAWTLGVHVILLPFSLVALYRYGDRTSIFAKSLGDTDDLLQKMRARIASALGDELSSVFERADAEPRLVTLEGYSERSTNPVGSEVYREAIQHFIEGSVRIVVDYGELLRARARWCVWARILSWDVLLLAIWEFGCVGSVGLATKFFVLELPLRLTKFSFAPTGFLIIAFFCSQAMMLYQHDFIHEKKNRYHTL
jgi:uncharacterized integral membrane protein